MVASHTAVPLGTAKWLVRATPTNKTLPLGKGHTQIAHVAYLKAGCILRGNLVPAISKHLKAFLYGWLPLSDASGIIFMLTAPIFNFSSLIVHLDAYRHLSLLPHHARSYRHYSH